jgi:hypothetical protein
LIVDGVWSMSHESFPVSNWKRAATCVKGRSTSLAADDYFGVVLSSAREIRGLEGPAKRLMRTEDTMLSPQFFLASLSDGWRPKVVAVCRERDVIGILYARERTIKGIPTGIVYADGSLGSILLADPLYHKRAFRTAIEVLLASPRIRSIRLRILHSSRDFDGSMQLTSSISHDVRYFPIKDLSSRLWKNHAHLPLADTYDQFLKALGSTTRHNFRYYRRRFEGSGHSFVDCLSLDELRSGALRLFPKSKLTARYQEAWIDRHLRMVTAAGRPLAVGLKHSSGEWLSVLGGWYIPGGAVLRFQCNNEADFGHDSLSVVLRAYLIESLIRQGLKELVIWADTGPPLSRYVTYAHTMEVRADVSSHSWRMARSIISTVEPLLPNRLAAAAHWIVG